MLTVDLRKYATNLEPCAEGWWSSPVVSDVSYPTDGNAGCFAVEEASFWFEHRNRCVLEAVKRFPPAGVLFDVGGGNGYVARGIQKSGFEVVLVEPGLVGVQNAVKRGLRHVVRSTLEDAGVVPHTLPAIGLFDVIEHIRNDFEFLTLAKDLLIPRGRLYLTVPTYQSLWSREDILAGHARRYNLRALKDVLQRAGFTVEFSTYFFCFLPLLILFRRTLPYRLSLRSNVMSKAVIRSEAVVRSEHEVRAPVLRNVLGVLTRWEQSKIAKERRLWLGASCLAVARSGSR